MARTLGLGTEYRPWLDALDALGAPTDGIPWPQPVEADQLLRQLELDELDRLEVLAALPSPHAQPALWWLLERAYHGLRRDIGHIDAVYRPWPSLPPQLGVHGRCFWVFVFLAAVADIRRWHIAHGVPDAVSWATLGDLGRQMRLYRRRSGHVGLDTHWWIELHFRGALFALGRLQFNPYRLLSGPAGPLFWYDAEQIEALGVGFRPGDRVLGVHIPEAGPLDPAACDVSFQAATAFFARHLPEHATRIATCTSWLLDEQLLEYLPAESNIVRFQRRFELVPGARDADASAFHFVFGRPPSALAKLQPRTTLERALVRHVAEGRHWRVRTGWLELP